MRSVASICVPDGDRALIDLHAHLLPGLDDGPADDAGSLALAEHVAATGTRTIVATPHLRQDFPDVRVPELPGRVAALQALLRDRGVDLEVLVGGEVDTVWAQHQSDETLRAVSYGGRGTDLLVETPYGELPPVLEELLFRIRTRGFRVLLAHPERNPSFQRDPERLGRIVDGGVLVQVTASSLTAGKRSRSCALAHALIAEGRAHVIAGDLHSVGGRAGLAEALETTDHPRARWMVTDAPAAILAGEPLPPAPSAAAPKRRRWNLKRER
ncbi:protein-tyrosine phosphatase [Solirubrobacter pauli]|uniref:protein-tyrosine-phosphatase n=1 Tax=Solirubrobacter pauli TaxID=166793 RepID=A0A660L9N0_9ACTN|nr:CpsB/CapC family capsule biosynthesis tyrosine phosphatase [Solirubrobacter pauli]RKQ91787.1 protein-tyrosine phosphatase [Solirubrobacter pauli]